jgi:hypothetical protein
MISGYQGGHQEKNKLVNINDVITDWSNLVEIARGIHGEDTRIGREDGRGGPGGAGSCEERKRPLDGESSILSQRIQTYRKLM